MRASHKMIVSMLFVGGALALSPIASAAPYLSVDFQSMTPQSGTNAGTPTGSFYYTHPSGSTSYVVDSNSTPPSPSALGGTGNHSLMLQNTTAEPRIVYAGANVGIAKGTASFDFYLVKDATFTNTYAYFFVGNGNTTGTSTIGPWMGIVGNKVRVLTPPSGGTLYLDNTVTPNAKHTLVINFDISPGTYGTYTGTLDGSPLTANSGAQTTFDFIAKQTKITTIGVSMPYAGQTFFDNLTLAVPEPASLGLLGMGAAGLLMRRRRR